MDTKQSKPWLMAAPLATVAGKLLALISVSHNSNPLSPEQRHLFQPANTIKTQPFQNGSKLGRNMTPLVGPNSTACPINQHQVVGEGIGQLFRLPLAGKRQQQWWQNLSSSRLVKALFDTGVVTLLWPIGQRGSYRIEVNIRHTGQQG